MLTSDLFDPKSIDAETAKFNAELEEMFATIPPHTSQTPQAIRDAREAGEIWSGPIVRLDVAKERHIPGPAGDIPLRVFVPDTVNGVYLHIHGGGWVLGQADYQDQMLWDIATMCKVAVVSVEYRLAPEHPYPAGPDDCERAALWLAENANAEFGSDRLTIGGESAGGHLSAVTLLRMRDRHGFTGFAGANLTYGAFDLSLTPSVANWGERNLVLNTPTIKWFVDHFVPSDRRGDPDVSPLYADLSDMPPALFTIGTLDPLLDDTLFMYPRWLAAGNDAELAVYSGGVHGFTLQEISLARQARARIRDFIVQSTTNVG
jgi:acetyl esterase/lipase